MWVNDTTYEQFLRIYNIFSLNPIDAMMMQIALDINDEYTEHTLLSRKFVGAMYELVRQKKWQLTYRQQRNLYAKLHERSMANLNVKVTMEGVKFRRLMRSEFDSLMQEK